MKLGKVQLSLSYVVDLDNQEMVDYAKQCLHDDLQNMVKYDEISSWIAECEDERLRESDIPDFLIEDHLTKTEG